MPDTGAPDSAVQDAITDPFDIMPDEDGVDRCEQNKTVKNVTLQPSDRSHDRAQLSRLLAPRVRKELELRDGVVGTAGQSKSAECRRITRRQAQSRVDDPDPSEVSSTMPQRINLREAGLRRSVRQAEIRAQRDDKEALTTRATKRKAHVAFGRAAQRVITLFALLSHQCDASMPSLPRPPNASPLQRFIIRVEEANQLVEGRSITS